MKLTSELKKDLGAAFFAYAVSLWIWICSFSMESYTNNRLSPAFIPRVIAVALIVLGTVIVVRSAFTWKRLKQAANAADEKEEPPVKRKITRETLMPYLTLLFIMLYLIGIKLIGFTVSSVLFLTGQITLLSGKSDRKTIIKYAVISVIASFAIWLLFYKLLSLGLPVNRFGF